MRKGAWLLSSPFLTATMLDTELAARDYPDGSPHSLENARHCRAALAPFLRFHRMLSACKADYRGRAGYADRDYHQVESLRRPCRTRAATHPGARPRDALRRPEDGHVQRVNATRGNLGDPVRTRRLGMSVLGSFATPYPPLNDSADNNPRCSTNPTDNPLRSSAPPVAPACPPDSRHRSLNSRSDKIRVFPTPHGPLRRVCSRRRWCCTRSDNCPTWRSVAPSTPNLPARRAATEPRREARI